MARTAQTTEAPADLRTIEAAAAECRERGCPVGRERLRQLVKDAGIGIPWGGSKDAPRLMVRMAELWPVLLAPRFEKKAAGGGKSFRSRRPAAPAATLHPDVRC